MNSIPIYQNQKFCIRSVTCGSNCRFKLTEDKKDHAIMLKHKIEYGNFSDCMNYVKKVEVGID